MKINTYMQLLNAGLIGFGVAGEFFHAPFLSTLTGWHLHSIVSSRADKIKLLYPTVTILNNSETLFSDPNIDVIVITAPNLQHFTLAKQALLAGKHVVVEKPFVISLQEAQELCVIAKQQYKVLTVFHNRRWDNGFLTLKKLLAEHTLGKVSHLEIHFDRFRPQINPFKWREQNLAGSGLLYDLGSHLIDQALHLFGQPDNYVADLAMQRDNSEAVDYFHIILHYNKLRVILHASNIVAHSQAHIIAHGDKGSFIKWNLDPQEEQLRAGMLPANVQFGIDNSLAELTLLDDKGNLVTTAYQQERGHYAAFYQQLHTAIINDTKPPVLAEEALAVIKIIEEIDRAQKL